jgi:hypothetical protein
MKIKVRNIFLSLIGVFSLSFCCGAQDIENFYFKEAQPKGEESLTRIPANFRGLYMHDKDSTKRLHVTSDSVIIEIPMVQYCTKAELQAKNYRLRDTVVVRPNGVELPCFVKNDTVFFADYAQSVLFSVSDLYNIKKADDKLIVSKQINENKWECFILFKENERICIAYFDFDKKIKEINENKKIQKIKTETENYYLANFKSKDLLKIIDRNYFPRKQYFYKRFNQQ